MDYRTQMAEALAQLGDVSSRLMLAEPGTEAYEALRRRRDELLEHVRELEDARRRAWIERKEDSGDD